MTSLGGGRSCDGLPVSKVEAKSFLGKHIQINYLIFNQRKVVPVIAVNAQRRVEL